MKTAIALMLVMLTYCSDIYGQNIVVNQPVYTPVVSYETYVVPRVTYVPVVPVIQVVPMAPVAAVVVQPVMDYSDRGWFRCWRPNYGYHYQYYYPYYVYQR